MGSKSGSLSNVNLLRKNCDGWKQYVRSPSMFRRGKKKVTLLQTNYSLFNYLKTDKSAEAKRIFSQIVESVVDVTV
jgi:prepilin signal peptidase PulO-like enzyme (type II secretory pathway)